MPEKIKSHLRWGAIPHFMWTGLVILLIGILGDLVVDNGGIFADILVRLLTSLGSALIIAAIFSFYLNTAEVIDKITSLLADIVISRQFFANLSTDRKQEALKALLSPSVEQYRKFAHFDRFYSDVSHTVEQMKSQNIRSNFTITAHSYIDWTLRRVAVKGTYTYRVYPSEQGFSPLKVGFDAYDEHSYCEKVLVSRPDGKRLVFERSDINLKAEENAGSNDRLAELEIQEFGAEFPHLDIELQVVEFGEDHWFLNTFKALQPTDGFRLHMYCHDGLEIRKHAIFDTGRFYHVERRGNTEIDVTCHQWVMDGVGVSLLIALPHDIDVDNISAQPPKYDELQEAAHTEDTHIT